MKGWRREGGEMVEGEGMKGWREGTKGWRRGDERVEGEGMKGWRERG